MLTGRPPFDLANIGGSDFAVQEKHVREIPPNPSRWNPRIPPSLDRVVLESLAKNPKHRIPGCQEFVLRLNAVEEEMRRKDYDDGSDKRGRRTLIAATAFAAAIVSLSTEYWLIRPKRPMPASQPSLRSGVERKPAPPDPKPPRRNPALRQTRTRPCRNRNRLCLRHSRRGPRQNRSRLIRRRPGRSRTRRPGRNLSCPRPSRRCPSRSSPFRNQSQLYPNRNRRRQTPCHRFPSRSPPFRNRSRSCPITNRRCPSPSRRKPIPRRRSPGLERTTGQKHSGRDHFHRHAPGLSIGRGFRGEHMGVADQC
jgi:hypothetical protein